MSLQCKYIPTHMYTRSHTYTHTHVHMHKHTHSHIHVCNVRTSCTHALIRTFATSMHACSPMQTLASVQQSIACGVAMLCTISFCCRGSTRHGAEQKLNKGLSCASHPMEVWDRRLKVRFGTGGWEGGLATGREVLRQGIVRGVWGAGDVLKRGWVGCPKARFGEVS